MSFEALEDDAQAYVLEQAEKEETRINFLNDLHQQYAVLVAEQSCAIACQELLVRIDGMLKAPRVWVNPKIKHYNCFEDLYRPYIS